MEHPSTRRRALVAVALAAVFAAVVAVVLSYTIFGAYSANHDEPVYVFQALTLRDGHLTLPAAELEPWFRPWLHGQRDGRLFSVFPPVWPALLAASQVVTGSMRPLLAVDAAAAVVLTYLFTWELLRRRAPAAVAAGLVAVSPFLLVLAGTRLSYLLALVLALAFGTSLLRGLRTGAIGWFATAGLAWGVLAFARPLDALLFGLIAAVGVGVRLARGELVRPLRSIAAAAAGAAPSLLLVTAYNRAVTGAPLRFPLTAAGGRNDLGFGPRQLTGSSNVIDFTPWESWRALRVNLWSLPGWTAGGRLIVPLVALGLWLAVRRYSKGAALVLVAVAVLVPLGNFFYWGNVFIINGKRLYGPHYYLALLVPLAVLAAVALVALARRSPALLGLTVAALVVSTGFEIAPKLHANREVACTNRQFVDEVRNARARHGGDEPDLVVLPSGIDGPAVMHPFPALGNPPDLDADVLYAADPGDRIWELLERHPDRTPFRLLERTSPEGDVLRRVPVVERLRPAGGRELRLPFVIVNPSDEPAVTAFVDDGVSGGRWRLDDRSNKGATYTGTWVVRPEGVSLEVPDGAGGSRQVVGPVAGSGARLVVGVGLGNGFADLRVHETHFWRRVTGDRVGMLVPGASWVASATGPEQWFSLPDHQSEVFDLGGVAAGERQEPLDDVCAELRPRFHPPEWEGRVVRRGDR